MPSLVRRPSTWLFAALLSTTLGARGTETMALDRALATIDPAELAADLHFIASDELGGRDTPSPGLRIAARFLRARAQRLGLEPGAGESYFHVYPLNEQVMDPEHTRLELRAGPVLSRLELGSDYAFYPSFSKEHLFDGGVVFAGGLLDVEGLEAEGRWVLCTCEDDDWRERERVAQEAGAIGVLLGPGPGLPDARMQRRCERWGERAARKRPGRPSDEVASFAHVYLTSSGFGKLLEAAGVQAPEVGSTLGLEVLEERAAEAGEETRLENVCALWPGSDPELRKEVLLLSAHYDHVGTRGTDVYNGADDNGSGTVALLALAEALVEHGPLRRSVLFLWVSGEEKGMWGSSAWAENPTLPEGWRVRCNLNLDMVGRNAPDELHITPSKKHEDYNSLVRTAEKLCALEGFRELSSADRFYHSSDQASFRAALGIPVAFLFTSLHEDYHEPTDTADRVDYDKLARVTRLALRLVLALDEPYFEF